MLKFFIPYMSLARVANPIGSWLLLLPCWWGLVAGWRELSASEFLWLSFWFAAGAVLMRGAGCTYNDLADANFDGAVARTKTRPLPSGAVSKRGALIFLAAQLFAASLVLLQFSPAVIILGLLSLGLVAIYPFMKRITWLPQFFLGLAFSWGVLMGWVAAGNTLTPAVFVLYAACVFWVVGYDTIYALQDKEDDLTLGLKSTALLFGAHTKLAVAFLFSLTWIGLASFGLLTEANAAFFIGLSFVGAHLVWQVWQLKLDDAALALRLFKSNRDCGLLIFASFCANYFGGLLEQSTL